MTATTSPLRIPSQAVPGLFLPFRTAEAGLTCPSSATTRAALRCLATQVTSGRSARVQLSSPLRPGSPHLKEVVQRPDSRPKPPDPAGRHASERIRQRPNPSFPSQSARGFHACGDSGAAGGGGGEERRGDR